MPIPLQGGTRYYAPSFIINCVGVSLLLGTLVILEFINSFADKCNVVLKLKLDCIHLGSVSLVDKVYLLHKLMIVLSVEVKA